MTENIPPIDRRSSPFRDLVGITYIKREVGHSQCALEVTGKLTNVHKTLHAGAIFTLADAGMGAAFISTLGEGESCVTMGINIVFLRGVTSGTIVCDSKVVHRGKNVGTVEAEITNEGQIAAKVLGTFVIVTQRSQKT